MDKPIQPQQCEAQRLRGIIAGALRSLNAGDDECARSLLKEALR